MSDFLKRRKGKSDLLRKLIAGRETIVAPGAYDALTARIIVTYKPTRRSSDAYHCTAPHSWAPVANSRL